MTTNERKLWNEGKDLWFEYVNVNGYSSTFTQQGLKKLSKQLDLAVSFIRERLNIYLNN
jgi:hypothetical protein